MSAPENPPAFPRSASQHAGRIVSYGQMGMSLRDYFAGQAMNGFCATLIGPGEPVFSRIAAEAYIVADAMLAERAKGRAE